MARVTNFNIEPIRARLLEFFKCNKLNNSRFEKTCGLYNGFVKDLDQQITFESLTKIATSYPNLNLGWIFSGVGSMEIDSPTIKEESKSNISNHGIHNNVVIIGNWAELGEIVERAVHKAIEEK